MRMRRLPVLLGLAMVLAACGKDNSSPSRAPAGPAAQQGSSALTSAPAGAPAAREKAKSQETQPKIARLNEDGSETVEDTTGDSGTHNPLLAAVASTVAATSSSAAAATVAGAAQEGTTYTRLVPAQPTSVPAGQVEVLEFFWYSCPHCYAMEPLIEAWLKTKPAYVSFSRVPVLWDEGHRSLARLYYTLDSLGKLNQFNADVFREIHVNGNPLIGVDPNNVAQAERVQLVFAKKLGISEVDFEKAYNSFDVNKNMQRADELVQRYRVTGVPTFVINGKYVTDAIAAGSAEKLMTVVSDLAAQEHKH
jgi:protein dithiol oxidoreductase (disulfide-forming)